MADVKVRLFPSQEEVELDGEQNLLEGLRSKQIFLRSGCGGNGSCGECVIKVKVATDLPELNTAEIKFLGNVFHITKERLACQCPAKHFQEIDLSAHDKQAQQQRMRDKNRQLRNKSKKT